MKSKDKLTFTAHALLRFRERWPECNHMERSTICSEIEKQILEARRNDDFAVVENGEYFPITMMGKDGFAVCVRGNRVATILPEEWCSQVAAVLKKKRQYNYSGVKNVQEHIVGKDNLDVVAGSDGKR